jgi:hypothetical protein
MKTFYLLPWLAILIYGTLSCEYQLNSENFRDIAPPDTTQTIRINLSPFDRQYMFTVPTYVTYDLNTFGLNVYNVEFFVGEQSIFKGNTQTGNFIFEPSPWGIGVETMTMVVTTNSNTGSLADLLGTEGLVFQHSWEVLLDGGNPIPVEITNIENKNGVLEIEWEKYERFNFQKYILYKNFGEVEWEGEKHKIAEINNQEIHRFADSSFVGGTGIYWVEIYASNQKAVSQRQRFDYPFPQLDTSWVSGGTARFSWNKNDFYNAVKKITLTMPDYYPKPDGVLFSTENLKDTAVVVDNLRFGSETEYTLSFYPKSDISIYQDNQIARSVLTFGTGKSIPEFSKILGSPKHDNVYLYWDGTVFQHKFPGMQLKSSGQSGFFTSWSVSNYDQSLTTVISYKMLKFDSENLANPTLIKPEEFDFQSFYDKTSISSKNQLAGPANTGTGIYDLHVKKMVFTQNNENLTGCVLSPDGQYAFVKRATGYQWNSEIMIFKITDDAFELIQKLEDEVYSQVDWIPERDHSLFILEGYEFFMPGKSDNVFKIHNTSKKETEYEITIKDGYFCGIDDESKRVAIWDVIKGSDTKQNLYIYDYTTGEIVKTIGLKHNFDVVYFWNNHLFSDKGFYINPSEY